MTMVSTAKKRSLLAVVALTFAVMTLFGGLSTAFAQQGVTWQTGNFCVEDFQSGAVCTAEDVRIATISPALSEVCLTAGDTATAYFTLDIVTGAQTRYDIGLFIATDGGLAKSGNACYHDFLQPPVGTVNNDGTPLNPAGVGPFANYDGDTCADTKQSSAALYKTQVEVTVTCTDDDNDGVVDPISTCTSWDNNAADVCSNVTRAFPGTNSKCNCEEATPDPPILLYKGYDFGDLPQGIVSGSNCPTDFNYPTLDASGPKHAIQDSNSNGTPNEQGGIPAIWLGPSVDFSPTTGESNGIPSFGADGDDLANNDDENGVAFTAPWYTGPNGGQISAQISADGAGACSVSNPCYLAMWIDWDGDGVFDNSDFPGERYTWTITDGPGVKNLTFETPVSEWGGCGNLYARVRLYDDLPGGGYAPGGLAVNGEVEDYNVGLSPTAVTLADFSAACVGATPVISWETVSELTNQGFNLYRGLDSASPDTQLNATLIPSQGPGSAQGFMYTWSDETAAPDTEYFYWLEDVDFAGATAMHGPISVMCSAPTAVSFSGLDVASTSGSVISGWLVALLLGVLLAGFVAVRRMRTN